ncbi:GNAT family N-acetyltransferase [Sandarakinorhabdus sp. AAP62]|uniref:GNAT family N-acetyltransferase n=1 Tax=Sandarakinorhabdus sp. AAP62 TaxID=1248916 RepID=UPI000312D7C9|nr:GNAT family N-acetyltransferase [Sandarakinorhabdus sp. AAP62]
MIRVAHPADLPLLPAIEASAATLFAGTAMAHVVGGATTPMDALVRGLAHRSLWVADDDGPCGFLLAAAEQGWLHVFELSVARGAQGHGLGAALLSAAIVGAPALGCERLSLTTDRFLAWNAPFYARHGFVEIAADDPSLPDWLAAMPEREAASGLDLTRRCIMVRQA